jgi:hypothetical protein
MRSAADVTPQVRRFEANLTLAKSFFYAQNPRLPACQGCADNRQCHPMSVGSVGLRFVRNSDAKASTAQPFIRFAMAPHPVIYPPGKTPEGSDIVLKMQLDLPWPTPKRAPSRRDPNCSRSLVVSPLTRKIVRMTLSRQDLIYYLAIVSYGTTSLEQETI